MNTTSNGEQGAIVSSKWPHEQLTQHLAAHTPFQAHRTVDGAPPAAQGFRQGTASFPNCPQEFIRQLGYSSKVTSSPSPPNVVTTTFSTSPIALNNNNTTKLDMPVQDKEIVEQPNNNCQLTPIKHELIREGSIEALNNNNNRWETEERPRSANDTISNTNNLSANIVAHHPLLSPVPFQASRLSWLADSKPALVGIAQPQPLKPEELGPESEANKEQESNDSVLNSQPNDESRPTLNDEETARLLLSFSQNFVNTSNANDSTQSPMEINVSASSDLLNSSSLTNGQRTNNNLKSRTFFRAPGHRNANTEPTDDNALICEICGFGCSSRFHYNSHMNTHGSHMCPICSYRSRTEGRLKKHMQDSHTAEQRREASLLQGDASASTNEPMIAESSNNTDSQRLPGTLEQIRALADNNISFGNNEQQNSQVPATSTESSQQPPKRSGGKPKKYSCKQCGQISTTKEDSWKHNKTHIPTEKQLVCTECDFVTEYKHHLQYHMRNHFNSKPFKCSKCEYQCVNKSMLNSHMKSHTPVYQFRCQDCTYQTKYCHSLKMHTYKYGHRRIPGQVYGTGEENAESVDDCMEGFETESMKNYDIPAEDLDAIERHKQQECNIPQQNQFQDRQPEIDNATSTSAQLSLINQQTMSTPRLSSLLLQPIASNPNGNNQLQQFLLQQQRIGQVQQLIHNVSNNFLPRHKCDVCEFTCGTQEEFLSHKINHYMHNQQQQQAQTNALHLYNQRLTNNLISIQQPSNLLDLAAQLRQQQNLHANNQIAISKADLTLNSHHDSKPDIRHNETPDPSGATTTTTASTPRVNGEHYIEEHMSGSSLHDEVGETSSSPSDSHKSMDAASSSPHSSSSAPHSGSKKRKARKLEEISQRLQDKCSPDHTDSGHLSPHDKVETSINGNTNLAQPIPSMAPINGLTNGSSNSLINFSSNGQNQSQPMPYECRHCSIAFSDQALYQIHLGYHGFSEPFKCNRCGFNADSSLTFNLHLYQEKH